MKALLAALLTTFTVLAEDIRRIPPPGIEVPAADRAEIEAGVRQLGDAIAPLKKDYRLTGEIPNVEIFHKSADWALRYNEIFEPKQIAIAKDHIKQGLERAAALAKGATPWNSQTGLLVRAYRSKIDDSVQPYGLVIPADWKPGDGKNRRLDFWCHGRGEKLSELAFIADRQKNPGEFVPEGAIICHLYGRYCNANKFAGETDLFEALDDIKKHYEIDERRLVIRGFSMGGASTWQFATHFPGMWAAAAPGAGFAETAEFFKVFAPGKEAPPAWEQKLWRWYDCTTMAANLANTSVVAYSGEVDGQKQAADLMVKYAAQEGITFPHIIGPQTAHKYHKDLIPEIEELVTAALERRKELRPLEGHFTTYSLIYPRTGPIEISALEKHWERADVSWKYYRARDILAIETKNVRRFRLHVDSAYGSKDRKDMEVTGETRIEIDGALSSVKLDRQKGGDLVGSFEKKGEIWEESGSRGSTGPVPIIKSKEVCGPIDHAFMSRFVFIRPTGKPLNEAIGAWTKAEMEHAIAQWRQVFRGDVVVMTDDEALKVIAAQPMPIMRWDRSNPTLPNLVLWGDRSSNKVLANIVTRLPLKWDATTLALGTQKVDAAHHAPILIYPNPLNPARYIVLNSGPTFREAAALNNSDQTPKLPDWAVVDIRTPPGPKWPGKIVDAGFFDENWK